MKTAQPFPLAWVSRSVSNPMHFERTPKAILLVLCVIAGLAESRLQADTFTFGTLAGNVGTGNGDGLGGSARFISPAGAAVDSAGNLYIADTFNHTVRKITPGGIVSTFAGMPGVSGSANGTGFAARFNGLNDVAVDGAGYIYVADFGNNTIRKITPTGVVTTLAGLAGVSGSTDGPGSNARFNGPTGLAVDSSNNVYVADTFNQTIRKITPVGVVSTFAGSPGMNGSVDGTGSTARFYGPYCIGVDAMNNLYISESANNTIRRITPEAVVSTFAGTAGIYGSVDGVGVAASFNTPLGVTVDNLANVYVADYGNHTIRRITPARVVSTWAGLAGSPGYADGIGNSARFNKPFGVAADNSGNVYVGDYYNYVVRKITPARVVSTFAGQKGGAKYVNGLGAAARFNGPNSVAVDSTGNVYVADETGDTIRKVTPAGLVSTLAGLNNTPGSANGTGTAARFNHPEGVGVDSSSNIYVADQYNHTIRKITPAGVVTTLAGQAGALGSADGTGSSARFNNPSSVAADMAGNIYVADFGNNTIRKITPAGVVTTLAGLAGSPGSLNGNGSAARFDAPYGVAVDSSANVYVAEVYNNDIRTITPTGDVTTLAGLSQFDFFGNPIGGSADGTGNAARFNGPNAVAVDSSNNVYVADSSNFTIRKITPGGLVSTIGGLALASGSADGKGGTARFNLPYGIAVDEDSNLYIADFNNSTVRKGIPTSLLPPPILQSPVLLDGQFGSGITGASGFTINIEKTIDFSNWNKVGTFNLSGGTNYFLNDTVGQDKQFFRANLP